MQENDQYVLNTYDGYFLSRLYYRVSDHYIKRQQGWDATSKFGLGKTPSNDELSYLLKSSPDSLAPNTKALEKLITQKYRRPQSHTRGCGKYFPCRADAENCGYLQSRTIRL